MRTSRIRQSVALGAADATAAIQAGDIEEHCEFVTPANAAWYDMFARKGAAS